VGRFGYRHGTDRQGFQENGGVAGRYELKPWIGVPLSEMELIFGGPIVGSQIEHNKADHQNADCRAGFARKSGAEDCVTEEEQHERETHPGV
jgi:hypothetical protein